MVKRERFQFSKEKRDAIRVEIKRFAAKKYDPEHVQTFIDTLELYLAKGIELLKNKKPLDQREDLKSKIKNFKDTIKLLCRLVKSDIAPKRNVQHLIGIEEPEDFADHTLRLIVSSWLPVHALKAVSSLREVIVLLEQAKALEERGSGHPTADEMRFAKKIAEIYRTYIGIPRPCSGAFPTVVRYVYEEIFKTTGSKDLSRAIRQALKN